MTVVPRWFVVPYSASVVTCLLVERFVDFSVILQILAVQDATVTLGQVFLVNKTILDLIGLNGFFVQIKSIGMTLKLH